MPLTAPARPPGGTGLLRGATGRLAVLAGPVMLAIAVQSAANLLFHAALGRSLAAADYGALGSVLAAMTLVAVPLTALQTASARLAADGGLSGSTGRSALARSLRILAPIAVLLVLAAAPLRDFLHLGSWWDAALLAPTLLISGLLASARGLLLGTARSRMVAGTYLVSTTIRLGLGILLAAPLGVTGALIGTVLGELAALMLATRAVWPDTGGMTRSLATGDLARTTAVVTGLFAFTTVDLFLARHHLPGDVSGAYVAAATIGKTILALPAAAMSVAYPRLVAAWSARAGERTALRSSLVVVGAPAMAGALVVAIAPGLVLTLLYGSAFPAATGSLVRALALIAGASAFASVLAHAAMARRSRAALLPWAGAVVQVVAISLWHSSPMAIAMASGASLLLSMALLGGIEARTWRSAQRR
jgi:O-antigen/teichoic acid export membrane protein